MLNIVTNSASEEMPKCPCGNKKLRDMVIDSAIIGGIAAFSVWNGTGGSLDLLASLKAFGISFFIQFAYYRGVKKP